MSVLQFPFADAPAPGTTRDVAPGVHWLRAMGEAIAHLHFLQRLGRLRRSVGEDGVARFAPAKREAWKTALMA